VTPFISLSLFFLLISSVLDFVVLELLMGNELFMQSKDDMMLVVQELILDPSSKGKLTATLPDSPDHVINIYYFSF